MGIRVIRGYLLFCLGYLCTLRVQKHQRIRVLTLRIHAFARVFLSDLCACRAISYRIGFRETINIHGACELSTCFEMMVRGMLIETCSARTIVIT